MVWIIGIKHRLENVETSSASGRPSSPKLEDSRSLTKVARFEAAARLGSYDVRCGHYKRFRAYGVGLAKTSSTLLNPKP